MRAGESLVEMDTNTLKRILNEKASDYSSRIIPGLLLPDLDEDAIEIFKAKWAAKANRKDYLNFTNEKLLRAAGLQTEKGLNYASLILFGKKRKD